MRRESLRMACGCVSLKTDWLQIGYKILKEPVNSPKYVDCLDKKRTESTYYNHKSRSETLVGMIKMWICVAANPHKSVILENGIPDLIAN